MKVNESTSCERTLGDSRTPCDMVVVGHHGSDKMRDNECR